MSAGRLVTGTVEGAASMDQVEILRTFIEKVQLMNNKDQNGEDNFACDFMVRAAGGCAAAGPGDVPTAGGDVCVYEGSYFRGGPLLSLLPLPPSSPPPSFLITSWITACSFMGRVDFIRASCTAFLRPAPYFIIIAPSAGSALSINPLVEEQMGLRCFHCKGTHPKPLYSGGTMDHSLPSTCQIGEEVHMGRLMLPHPRPALSPAEGCMAGAKRGVPFS